MTVVVTVISYTMGAAAKQQKKNKTKFIYKKGDLKLWHVEMLTKPKTLSKRLT